MDSAVGHLASPRWGCPIRRSADHSLLAAPRGFSQPSTSFIGSWCQGIHRAPLLARRLDLSNSPQPAGSTFSKRHLSNKRVIIVCRPSPVTRVPRLSLLPAQLLFDSSGAFPTLTRAPVVAPRPGQRFVQAPRPALQFRPQRGWA